MLLKLVLPYRDREFVGGVLVKWHKAEGEWVNYGEDLFDLRVQEVRGGPLPMAGRQEIELMTNPQTAEAWSRENELFAAGALAEDPSGSRKRLCFMRVTSSDAGWLRRACSREGDPAKVGELVALLTTEEGEPLPDDGAALAAASVFRAVVEFTAPELE
jgi:hypothetical protein